jgi:light-regulated signal transduction histidine kinase (bacteriophytochrome)
MLDRHQYLRYVAAVLFAILAQIARIPIEPSTLIPFITYVPFILFSSWLCGMFPGLLTGLLCTLQAVYFALEPVGRLEVSNPRDYLGIAALATSAIAIGVLVGKLNEIAARLTARTAELERSNEDLQTYAYSVSHDLQEPLRNVSLYVDLLNRMCASCIASDPQKQTTLEVIGSGAKRMTAMLSSLLLYSRATNDDDSREWIDTEEVARGTVRLLQPKIAETGAVVEIRSLPRVYAWRGGLDQVFQNLLDNALKYHSHERIPTIAMSCDSVGPQWRFSVSDNGIGFDEKYADRIFGVFKRLHVADTYPGTGIGLAIVRRIVNRHGGRAWAHSVPGRGSSFLFTIPKSSGDGFR